MSRKRRTDADRNAETVVHAAIELFGRQERPGMADIARAAGVTRQTVYAHFPTRDALLAAVVSRLTELSAQALSEVESARGSAGQALALWLDSAWRILDQYPALSNPALFEGVPADVDAHEPILGTLRRILNQAQGEGRLVPGQSIQWLTTGVIALGHAAGAEAAAGRMTKEAAGSAFSAGALRLCLDVGPAS
jgi:AcrR family transcriptional regulator